MKKQTLLKSTLCLLMALVCNVAWAQTSFTFTRGENKTATVTAPEGLTATMATNVDWLTGGAMASNTGVLCPDKNTRDATIETPITFTLTVSGLTPRQEFTSASFTHRAVSSTGDFQSANSNTIRHCNLTLTAGGEQVAALTDQNIWIPTGSTDKVITFDNAFTADAEGNLTLTLTIVKGTDNEGCFYGLTKIELYMADPIVTFTNVQQDGKEYVLYINEDGVLSVDATQTAEEIGAPAQFRATKQANGKYTFYNEYKQLYMIWRGNSDGYNDNKGTLGTYEATYCDWEVKSSNTTKEKTMYFVGKRKNGTDGSIVILNSGAFDKFGNSIGFASGHSNIYKINGLIAPIYQYESNSEIIYSEQLICAKGHNLPSPPVRDFVTYTFTEELATDNHDCHIQLIPVKCSLPFELSNNFADAKWYYMTIHSADRRNVQSAETYPYNNSAKPNSSYYSQWAFVGNPFEGISIYNRAFEGKTLGFDATRDGSSVYMKDGVHKWTVDKGDDGFALRQGANQYINDYGQQLKIWNSGSSNKDADGNEFNVVPVDGLFYQSWGNHYPWSNAEVVDVPNGLQVCEYDGGAQGHVLRKAETKINATGGDISVTFTYSSGTDMLMIAGVDLVKDRNIVKREYHEGKSGGELLNNEYILTDVEEGEYILRYFVCDMPSGEDKHDLTKTGGQIKVVGANRMPIEVVYNYMLDGQIRATENFDNVPFGGYYPDIKYDEFPYGIAAPIKPSGLLDEPVIMDGVATVTVELQHNLPFERSASATDNPKWYIVDMHSNDNGEANIYNGVEKYLWTYIPDGGTANVQLPNELSKQTELFDDDKLWCFVGNVYDGFKIYNKLAGESVTLNKKEDGNTDAYMSDATEATSYLVSTSDVISGALCFQPKGHVYYLNTNGSGSVGKLLKGWDDKSGGSSCRMFAPTDFVKETIMAEYDGDIPACAVGTKKELTRDAYALLSSTMTSLEENGWNTDLVTEEVSAVLTRLMGSDERIQLKEGYYLIKGTGTGNNASWYATYYGNNNEDLHARSETPGVKHIWFFDKVEDKEGYKFMACNTGKYVKLLAAASASSVTSDYMDGSMFTFTENDGHKYTIKDGNNNVMRTENDGRINYWGSEKNETWYLISATDMEIPVAISNAGAATLYSSVPLSIPEDVTAKYLKVAGNENSQGTLHYTTLKNTIPANTPVVLIGGEKQHTFKVAEDVAAVEGNILFGYSFDTAVSGSGHEATGQDGTIYALANKTNGLGFYHFNDNTYKAGKAYLDVSGLATSGVRFFNIFDEDNETGVEEIEIVNDNHKSEIYDLSGRRVQTAKKGLYIVNGKKVIR